MSNLINHLSEFFDAPDADLENQALQKFLIEYMMLLTLELHNPSTKDDIVSMQNFFIDKLKVDESQTEEEKIRIGYVLNYKLTKITKMIRLVDHRMKEYKKRNEITQNKVCLSF